VVALLDSDDAWPANHVRTAVEVLDARPAVGLVYGDITVIVRAAAANPWCGRARAAVLGLR
jgi:hypothetical protein